MAVIIELFFVMAAKVKVKNLAEFKDNNKPLGIHKRQAVSFMCNIKLFL